ncbi:MAG TPA: hypothetical protein VLB27_04275 [candidate division Zixibacteria bacterium]|nr:hypothetical protein [candidate division Zixibacteria bacterium]
MAPKTLIKPTVTVNLNPRIKRIRVEGANADPIPTVDLSTREYRVLLHCGSAHPEPSHTDTTHQEHSSLADKTVSQPQTTHMRR